MLQQYSPKQAQVLLAPPRRWNLMVGAASSGKTYVSYDVLPKRMRQLPPGNSLLIGKTVTAFTRNVLHPMQERFGHRYVSDISGRGEVRLFGRRCYVVGAHDESSYKPIQGITLVYAYGDEFATWPETFFKWLQSRLRAPGACFDGTANPEGPMHWAKVGLIDKADALDLQHWHFTLDDNPFLDPGYVAAIKTEYTGVWYQRLVLGLWVAAEGIVYDAFDQAIHVIQRPPVKMEAVWVTADYGTSNPTVFLLVGRGTDQQYYVLDEWRWDPAKEHRQKSDEQLADDLVAWLRGLKLQYSLVLVDPAALSFIVALRNRGVQVQGADNAVLDGIRRVHTMFAGRRLYVLAHCTGLIAELLGYVWDPKAAKRGEDAPIKATDHGPDALRYWANHVMAGSHFVSWT